jgi:hypothetical protein
VPRFEGKGHGADPANSRGTIKTAIVLFTRDLPLSARLAQAALLRGA